MYVCLCTGVNDTTIKKAIQAGCRTLLELKLQTGAMSKCCKCCGQCKELLREFSLSEQNEPDRPLLQ